MAREPLNLVIGQLASTALTEIYEAPDGINTTIATVGFTNTTSTAISIDIYVGSDGTDYLKNTMTLPAGSGQERMYYNFQRRVINAGQTVKIQADSTAAFNYDVNGSEVEI
jgi:hypothetical protein